MSGGGWDTLTVHSPLEGVPEGIFALMQGNLVARLLLGTTETNREHTIGFEIIDEDGAVVMKAEAKTHIPAQVGLPIGRDQGVNYVFRSLASRCRSPATTRSTSWSTESSSVTGRSAY
jgi:hypothetical protein